MQNANRKSIGNTQIAVYKVMNRYTQNNSKSIKPQTYKAHCKNRRTVYFGNAAVAHRGANFWFLRTIALSRHFIRRVCCMKRSAHSKNVELALNATNGLFPSIYRSKRLFLLAVIEKVPKENLPSESHLPWSACKTLNIL